VEEWEAGKNDCGAGGEEGGCGGDGELRDRDICLSS
jgi:hypothetical protein